jgi:hypothetical protein
MENLRIKAVEMKSALWNQTVGKLINTLKTRANRQQVIRDPLAVHEEEADKRNTPALFARRQAQSKEQRQRDPNP